MLVKEEEEEEAAAAKALTCIPEKKKKKKRKRSRSEEEEEQRSRALSLSWCPRCASIASRPPPSNPKPMILIRISGGIGIDMDYYARSLIFDCFHLTTKFTAVFHQPNDATPGMLRCVQPHVTYGYPNHKSIKDLIYNKGHANINKQKLPLTDNLIQQELGKYGIVCMEDMVHQIHNPGPHFDEVVEFMWPFELNKPSDGFKGSKKSYKDGGDAGNREDSINELINKMM